MDHNFCRRVIEEMPDGFALQQIIFDEDGLPLDFEYINVNEAFGKIFGKKDSEIIGNKGSEILWRINVDVKSWVKIYSDVAINGGHREEKIFSEALGCYFKIFSYSPEKNYFISIMTDITKEMKDTQEKTTILKALSDLVFELDEKLNFINVFVSDESLLFMPRTQIIGTNLKSIFSGELLNQILDSLEKTKKSGEREELTYKSPNGDENKWYRAKISYSKIDAKNTYVISVADITEQKLGDIALEKSEEKYRLIAEGTSDVIWVYNLSKKWFAYISPSLEQLSGFKPEEVMDWKYDKAKSESFRAYVSLEFEDAIKEFIENPQKPMHIQVENKQPCKDGNEIWVEISATFRYNPDAEMEICGITRNIEERKIKEEEIIYLSYHDIQTGLLNRNALKKKSEEIINCQSSNGKTSAIFIDLDNFRLVNDSLGHNSGDRIIEELAGKIKLCVGKSGTAYRYGGDEFVALIDSDDYDHVYKISSEILRAISRQINIQKRCFFITASVGIAMGNKDESIDQTIKNADTALYISKKKKNMITRYSPNMDRSRTRDAILEADMHLALQKNQFEIYYQPIIDIKEKSLKHAEALLRWNHPELGMIKPSEFIPISERNKLILPITDWVLSQVISKISDWGKMGINDISVGVNLSLLCFENRSEQLVSYIINLLKEHEISSSKIKLEITESIFMNKPEDTIEVFNQLKKHGIGLALDDFGTGYSSLGYLKDLPLNTIKLDGSLLDSIDIDEKEQTIVESLIAIIHGLKLVVIAECVETTSQYEILKKYGCDYIQGFLFSKALKEEDFVQFYFLNNDPKKLFSCLNL